MGSGAASKPSALKAVREAKTQSQGAKYCKYRTAMLGLSRRDSIDGTTDSVWLTSTGSIVINYKTRTCIYNPFLFFGGIHSFQVQPSFFSHHIRSFALSRTKMLSKAFAYLLLGAAHVCAQQPLRVITFNIRYANSDISIGDVERYWLGLSCANDPTNCRAPGVITTLSRHLYRHLVVDLEADHRFYS